MITSKNLTYFNFTKTKNILKIYRNENLNIFNAKTRGENRLGQDRL